MYVSFHNGTNRSHAAMRLTCNAYPAEFRRMYTPVTLKLIDASITCVHVATKVYLCAANQAPVLLYATVMAPIPSPA